MAEVFWKWVESDLVKFMLPNGIEYKVGFTKIPAIGSITNEIAVSIWFVDVKTNSTKLTGTGCAHVLFSTLEKIIINYHDQNDISAICFSVGVGDKREKFYRALMKRMKGLLNRQLKETEDEKNKKYWLVKPQKAQKAQKAYANGSIFNFERKKLNGKKEPMTIFDWIERVAVYDKTIIVSKESKVEYREIKESMIEEFGVKCFNELPEEVQAPYLRAK